jgi:hypothetical protein
MRGPLALGALSLGMNAETLFGRKCLPPEKRLAVGLDMFLALPNDARQSAHLLHGGLETQQRSFFAAQAKSVMESF